MKIAVIGGGPSGTTVVRKLLTSNQNFTIDVFEPRNHLVLGQAYQIDTQEAIMNEHARDLSINPEEPYEFLYWLEENYPEWAFRDAFVPRTMYGEYLSQQLYRVYHHPNVQHIQDEVVNMAIEDNVYHLQLEDNTWAENYSAVFFAIGHPPYADRYNLIEYPGYINHPFPIQDVLAQIGADKRVGVIGSGLTSLDIIKFLLKETDVLLPIRLYIHNDEPFNTVKFYRYDGELTISFSDQWIEKFLAQSHYIPLETMVETFKQDLIDNQIDFDRLVTLYGQGSLEEIALALSNQDEDLSKLRRYIVIMTQYLPDLYNALTPSDRDRYTAEYEAIFNHFRSQMPANSLEFVLNHIEQGSIELITELDKIYPVDQTFQLYTIEGQQFTEDVLINATGFQFDLVEAVEFNPLLKNLYDKEIFTPYYRGGISVTWPRCQVVTNHQGALDKVFLLGHWISKIHYGNNNIHLCIKQAERVVDAFLQDCQVDLSKE